MFHLAAFFQNVDQAGALAAINAVADPALYVVGTQVRVPKELPFLGGALLQTAAATITDVQIQTPSLRDIFYPSYLPSNSAGGVINGLRQVQFTPDNPLPLEGWEQLQFFSNTDDAAVQDLYGLVWLQDGPINPVKGSIFSIKATAAITLTAANWVNGQITFGQQLPYGDYQIVGMRAWGTGLVAARLLFASQTWRPGVPGAASALLGDAPQFRNGMAGVFGTFNTNVPPTLDCYGQTGTSQNLVFDLIKVS